MHEQWVFLNTHALLKRKVEHAFSFLPHTKTKSEKPWPVSFFFFLFSLCCKRAWLGEEILGLAFSEAIIRFCECLGEQNPGSEKRGREEEKRPRRLSLLLDRMARAGKELGF